MKKIQLVIALIMLLSISCKKDDVVLINAKIIENVEKTGEDCNWLLEVDNVIYCPSNLDNAYEIDNLSVMVSFNYVDRPGMCGFGNFSGYPKIDITEIKFN